MSFQALSSVWGDAFPDTCKGVGRPAVRLVALAVADIVNDMNDNEFWGSLPKVATKTGLNRDTVRMAFRHLEEMRVIVLLEERPGRPSRYRWEYDPQTAPDPADRPAGTNRTRGGVFRGVPRGDQGSTPREDPRQYQRNPTETNTVVNDGSSTASSDVDRAPEPLTLIEPERTPAQRGNAVMRAYWDWCVARYGRKPDIGAVALSRLLTGLIEGGATEAQIKPALKYLHENGRPITRATLGAAIDGRGPQPSRQNVAAVAAGMQFDDAGRLVGP